jgi:hypothetical protein
MGPPLRLTVPMQIATEDSAVVVPPRLRRQPWTTPRTCPTRSSRSSSRRARPPTATPAPSPARARWRSTPPPLPRRPRRAGQRCPALFARFWRGQPLRLRRGVRHGDLLCRVEEGGGVGRRRPSRRRDLRAGGRRSLDGAADGVGRRVGRRHPSRSRDLAEERGHVGRQLYRGRTRCGCGRLQ